MTHKISLFLAAGAALLLAPLTTSHAQYARGGSRLGAFSGGGAGRAGAIGSAPGARGYTGAAFRNNRGGYYGGRGGYYGGRSRYFHRGSYYYYDPFFFGGFGYPSYYYGGGYYGGFGPGFGVGYYGAPGYYGGYGDDEGGYYGGAGRVYNGRIASEVNGGRRRGGADDGQDGDDRGGRYSPNSMARAVQGELKERGYYRGSVDGQFGAGTASALRNFQRDKGLKVTGRLDERTLKALGFDER